MHQPMTQKGKVDLPAGSKPSVQDLHSPQHEAKTEEEICRGGAEGRVLLTPRRQDAKC